MPKPLTVWITANCGKFLKRWEQQIMWPASWETCMQVKKQQLEVNIEQQTGSKSGKEYDKAVCIHPAYLTSMQNISRDTLGWMNHKLESRLLGEMSITSDMQMTPPYGRKQRGTKEPLESERGEWKSWLKTQHSINKDQSIRPYHFMANKWGNNGKSDRLYFPGLQNRCRWSCSHEIKRCLLLGRKAVTNLAD